MFQVQLRSAARSVPARLAALSWCAWALVASPGAAAEAPLADAAKARAWDQVRALLAEGAAVDQTQGDGATALHWTAYWGEESTLQALVEAGATVNAANEYGATPLWAACATGQSAAVARLLSAGADPNLGLSSGETLLMRCAHTGSTDGVRALLTQGADIDAAEPERGQTALMRAVASGHEAVTGVLLEAGADFTARTRVVQQLRGTAELSTTSPQGSTYFEAGGFTALLFAARHGDLASARWLLDAGAPIDDPGADGNTPLVLAALSGHETLARYLLERGADPDSDGAGYTGLHAAALRRLPALMADLLARGADPNRPLVKSTPVPRWPYQHIFTRREEGATPLLLAAKYLEPDMVRLLAEYGAHALQPMDDGTTPLMAAVGLGASRSTTRRNRLIAPELVSAEWADGLGVRDTVQALLDVGAGPSLDTIGRSGNTALHNAARYRFSEAAQLLVEAGADPRIANEAGTTAEEMLLRLEGAQ